MKATKAYIASLGTTGVLLAASVLMLAVVSAVVAFDGWPGAGVQAPVQTLVLNEKPAAIRVSSHSSAPSATPAAARVAPARTLAAAPRAIGRTPALPGGGPTAGTRTPAALPVTTPAVPVATPVQKTVQQTTDPLFDAVSNPGTTAGQIATGTQQVTDAAGTGLAKVDPDLGNAVTATGQAAAQAVSSLPLPQHLLPGR